MKKKKALIIAFVGLMVSTLSFTVATFAWFTSYHPVQTVNVDGASLKLTSTSDTVYKYVYPYYSGSTIVDYDSAGTVTPIVPTTAKPAVEMNIFDPTYITIVLTNANHPGTAHSQSDVSLLNTNLVFAFTFSVTYSTPISLAVSAKRNASFTHNPTSGAYGVSHYANFFGLSSADFASAGGVSTDGTSIFNTVKGVAENATNLTTRSVFANDAADASLTFFNETLVDQASQPAAETTTSFTFYLNIDYQDSLCSAFYDGSHLGKNYALTNDYTLSLLVAEVLA
jgi:hypothetical protein